MNGQIKRNLGKGMKPRGVNSIGPDIDNSSIEDATVSDENGISENQQLTEPECPLADVSEPEPDPPNLATGSETSFVAQEHAEEVTEEVQHISSGLEALMKQSTEVDPSVSSNVLVIPTAEEVTAIEQGDRLPNLPSPDYYVTQETPTHQVIGLTPVRDKVGPRPNGDYGVVVTVPEQMVSLVLGQAEMDGVSPGEWLTTRLGEYLESWTFGR